MTVGPRENPRGALAVLTTLFFMWGFLTCLNDVLIPHLKAAFALSFTEAALVQFSFFTAYAMVSVPAGALVAKIGYARGIVLGLVTAGVGCLGFYPAASTRSYGLFLVALFVLAAGITVLQVSANPYVAILGPARTAPARLTLTQAFNSLGTFLAPWFGSLVILSNVAKPPEALRQLPAAEATEYMAKEASSVQVPYIGLAVVLFVLAFVIHLVKLPTPNLVSRLTAEDDVDGEPLVLVERRSAWAYPHLVLGAVAIFLYVGAEVSIGSFLVVFFKEPDIGALPEQIGGRYLMFYWGGSLVGRFVGAVALRRFSGGRAMATNAIVAVVLCLATTLLHGRGAMACILAVGLANSILFPTIFALAVRGLGRHTEQASGVICMAIVGGALVPLLHGAIADHWGLHAAFVLPAVCYAYIAFYGLKGSRMVGVG